MVQEKIGFVENVNKRTKETSNGSFLHSVGISVDGEWYNYKEFSEEQEISHTALNIYKEADNARVNKNKVKLSLYQDKGGYTCVGSIEQLKTTQKESEDNDPTKKYDFGMAVKVAGEIVSSKIQKAEGFSNDTVQEDFKNQINLCYNSIREARKSLK